MRFDLQVISSRIDPGATLLDLGCGNGELLDWLARHKQINGSGIERDKEKAAFCISKGLRVLQGDMLEEMADYPDKSFDYVVLSQTLQQVYEPAQLLYSLARIGKRFIVSFPNFSHWLIRLQLLLNGAAPKSQELPYNWYDSPNIRVITLKDFRKFAADVGYQIIEEIAIKTGPRNRSGKVINLLRNCRASYGIYIIEKS